MDNHRTWTVNDIKVIETRGPWDSKSGGKLNVMFSIPFSELQERYLNYDKRELESVINDIRGLRVYTVRKLPIGKVGAMEWHKVREEIVFVLEGSILWTCEDLFGGKKDFLLNSGKGVWTPPYILHSYQAQEENSGLFVLANTLFIPDDPKTHDSYSIEKFHEIQARG